MKKPATTTTFTHDTNNAFSGFTFAERREMNDRENALKALENVTFDVEKATKTPLAPIATSVDMNARYDAIYAFTVELSDDEKTTYTKLVYDVEHEFIEFGTFSKVLELATASTIICLKTIHKKTGDKTIGEMLSSTCKDGVYGLANDHIQECAIAIIERCKTFSGIRPLTGLSLENKAVRSVFVDDELNHTVKTKSRYMTGMQYVFYKIRENIKSYDSFKYLDTRRTCIELDAENVENTEGLSYSTRFYQLISYNSDTNANHAKTSFMDFETLLEKLELNDLEKQIVRVLNNNVGLGYKNIAYVLFGEKEDYDKNDDRNKYVERVKKCLSRLRRKALENDGLQSKLGEMSILDELADNGYNLTDEDLFKVARDEMKVFNAHEKTFYYLANVENTLLDGGDISTFERINRKKKTSYKKENNKKGVKTVNDFQHDSKRATFDKNVITTNNYEFVCEMIKTK